MRQFTQETNGTRKSKSLSAQRERQEQAIDQQKIEFTLNQSKKNRQIFREHAMKGLCLERKTLLEALGTCGRCSALIECCGIPRSQAPGRLEVLAIPLLYFDFRFSTNQEEAQNRSWSLGLHLGIIQIVAYLLWPWFLCNYTTISIFMYI